jgi:hypothetical protein
MKDIYLFLIVKIINNTINIKGNNFWNACKDLNISSKALYFYPKHSNK